MPACSSLELPVASAAQSPMLSPPPARRLCARPVPRRMSFAVFSGCERRSQTTSVYAKPRQGDAAFNAIPKKLTQVIVEVISINI
jgi:hypothetical protein